MLVLFAEHVGLHDATLLFVLALAALIVAIIAIVQSWPGLNLVAIGLGLASLALVIEWWPN